MTDLYIEKINDVHIRINCDAGMAQELAEFFTFSVPGAHFMPSVRNKVWDGKVRLFNTFTKLLYAGLVPHVIAFAQQRDYTFECGPGVASQEKPTEDAVVDFFKALNLPKDKTPRDYQLRAFLHAARNLRAMMISPTASGKSLIIYTILSWFDTLNCLVVVPTKGLVTQMRGDFIEYGCDPRDISIIMGGESKDVKTRIVITTWQSVYEMPKKWFARYGAIFGDEAHLFKAKSLEKIMGHLTECPVRIGTTGTLDGSKVNKLVLEGMFGPVIQVERTSSLMAKGQVASLKVRCTVFEYSDIIKRQLSQNKSYQDELDFLCSYIPRNEFIVKFVKSLKGNTLVLFNYVDKHGKPLYEMFKKATEGTDRKVFLVYGGTDAEQRESVRQIVENEKDAIIVASYGTFSTGVNIRNLHNAVAASPTKSIVRLLQSIGRILRLGSNKDGAVWYDLADDLTWKSRVNHTLKHFAERIKIYNEQNFDVKIYRWRLS